VYTHHGIDAGDGSVIHFAGEPGLTMQDACVTRSSVEKFLQGGVLQVRPHPIRLSPDAIAFRAQSRIGESGYNLFRNNCEHFATWCATGRGASEQVRIDLASAVAVLAGLAFGTVWLRHR
jgi:hypothetical protein